MSAKGNLFENELLRHVFLNEAITLIGDAAGLLASATAGSLYVSLHTADPGEGGSQTTNETGYGSYARVAVARTTGGWTVTTKNIATDTNNVQNAATITFAQCSSGSSTVTHWAVGTDSSGTGKILYKGALAASLPITSSPAMTPSIAAGGIIIEEQ